ncbi:uncharacterized small protein (DUF1192 family) [Variovorax boronicumulans]|uniref:hypothetical protein n=1 Tax=Variovorax boronicumulans TaxID=436515 RepID=UPI00277DB878|nr:hypothetical protein [Variovorax boronicumulans]MDQ0080208.1 uncharacterized small protein (DUF1192 family) [Variovorax boronicumulans]
MQAPDVQHRHATDKGRYAPWPPVLVVAGLMTHACALWAQAEPGASQVIGPQQQAARDHDRIAILREELGKSQAQLEDLARRKAERLAASDMQAATEAEAQRVRTIGDIAAIQREIASTSRTSAQTAAAKPMAAQATKGPASAGKRAAPTPWWDVYGGSRRIDPSASVSLAPPSGQVPAGSSSATGVSP